MKREELKSILGEEIEKEKLDKIMELAGKDINTLKETNASQTTELEALRKEKETWKINNSSNTELTNKVKELTAQLENQKKEHAASLLARDKKDAAKKMLNGLTGVNDLTLLEKIIDFEQIEFKDGAYNKEQFEKQIETAKENHSVLFDTAPTGGRQQDQKNKFGEMSEIDMRDL